MKSLFKPGILAITMFLSIYVHGQDQWALTTQLIGKWRGQATLILGDQSFGLTYNMHFKSELNGPAMTMDEWFTDPVLGSFKGANLIGLSAFDGQIHWFSADNLGTAHEHIGAWSDNKHFHMENHSPVGGQTYHEYIDVVLNANNSKMDIILTALVDADTVQILFGTMVRTNGNNSANITMSNDAATPTTEIETLVFPNPSTGQVNIEGTDIIDEVTVLNDSGRIVHQATPDQMNYSFLLQEPGTYLITLNIGTDRITKKLIVKKL